LRQPRELRSIAIVLAVLLPAALIWSASAFAAGEDGTAETAASTVTNQSNVDQTSAGGTGETGSAIQSVHVSQSTVASATTLGTDSSATATATSTSNVNQTSSGAGSTQPGNEQAVHVAQSATATASDGSTAVAGNVADLQGASESSTNVVQNATATASDGNTAVAGNVAEVPPSNERSTNVVQTAKATAAGGQRGSDAPAVAINVARIAPASSHDPGPEAGGVSGAEVCNAAESRSTCSQENAASVEQTAEANGAGSLALNVANVQHSDQTAVGDAGAGIGGDSGSSNSAAGVCNAGGPAVNCTQEHDVRVSQTAVADGVGALAVNDADVHTANQIAGRDAGVDSSAGHSADTNSAAGVCNAGGPTVNCTQKSTIVLTQTSIADGDGAVATSEADVWSVNQIAGRDTGVDSTGGRNQSTEGGAGVCAEDGSVDNCSAAGVCNVGGPAVSCTQENTVAVDQRTTAAGDGAAANSELELSAVNQITGRDAGAGATGGVNQNVASAAGVCNAGGPAIGNCVQENTLSVEVTTAADGDEAHSAGQADIAAVNQIAGRDTLAGSRGGDGAGNAGETRVAAINQITGRDAGAGLSGADDRSSTSAAGVCNAGGESLSCTQKNTVTVASTGSTDATAVNQIAGRDAGAGWTERSDQGTTGAAGVCNSGGPVVNCTQENTVAVAPTGDETDVAAANQIAGRDAGAGSTGGSNQDSSSAAGVCNAGGEVVNCTQANSVSGAATAGETEGAAVNQIAGRDAVAGAAIGSRSDDSEADVCNSDGAAPSCAQQNRLTFESNARVTAINQTAGRTKHLDPLFGFEARSW
jgi:hypothetical protein